MGAYQHILMGVDLTKDSQQVASRAVALATSFNARLSCAHVIEPLSLAYGGDIPMDLTTIQEQIQKTAKVHLHEFATQLGISEENQHLTFGRPETEIDARAAACGPPPRRVVATLRGPHRLTLGGIEPECIQ